jgi:hypothetical protein
MARNEAWLASALEKALGWDDSIVKSVVDAIVRATAIEDVQVIVEVCACRVDQGKEVVQRETLHEPWPSRDTRRHNSDTFFVSVMGACRISCKTTPTP